MNDENAIVRRILDIPVTEPARKGVAILHSRDRLSPESIARVREQWAYVTPHCGFPLDYVIS